MIRKINYPFICFCLFVVVAGTGLTGCRKQKTSADPVVEEMPLPDPDKNYYTPDSYQNEISVDGEEAYDVVEQMPQFPGGDEALMRFLSRKIKYPVVAQENGIQGKVICGFVVTKTGQIVDVNVLRSLDPSCDKEAIRVIKLLPRWIPGKQNGVNVAVKYTLPLRFKLE